jgi:hypothetical protein
MPIIRVEKDKENPYVMVNKEYLDNKKLSFKAKGLLTYLLSKPDDWSVYVEQLKQTSKDNRSSVDSAIKELIKYKYVKRIARKKDKGQFKGYDYTVYENPLRKNRNGSAVTEKPYTENLQLLNNEKTNKGKTNIIDSCRIHELKDKRKHKYIWCKSIKTFFCPNNEKYCLNECYKPCREVTDDWALKSNITSRENLWQCRINDPRYKIAFKKIVMAFKERDPGGLADKIRRWNNMTKEQIEEYNARPLKRVQE